MRPKRAVSVAAGVIDTFDEIKSGNMVRDFNIEMYTSVSYRKFWNSGDEILSSNLINCDIFPDPHIARLTLNVITCTSIYDNSLLIFTSEVKRRWK